MPVRRHKAPTSDLSVFNWDKANLILFSASKIPDNYIFSSTVSLLHDEHSSTNFYWMSRLEISPLISCSNCLYEASIMCHLPQIFSLPVAYSIQRSYPPWYGVSLMYGVHSFINNFWNRMESKAFRLINTPPLTDCLPFLKHHRFLTTLAVLCSCFHSYCSYELANNYMPPALPPRPRCTRLSTLSSIFCPPS